MSRIHRALSIFAFSSAFLVPLTSVAQTDYHDNPNFQKKWEEAKHTRQVDDKATAYRKANDASGNRCDECLVEAIHLSGRSDDRKQVEKTTDQLLKMSTASPNNKAKGLNYAGLAFAKNPGEAKPSDLEKAHAYYAKAIEIDPTFDPPYFNDGLVLVAMDKKEEAVKVFQAIQNQKSIPENIRDRAARYEKEPELVLVRHTPTLSMDTLDGKTISLNNLGNGKVTVLIFCQTTADNGSQSHYINMLPHLQQIAQQYRDAPFQMVSVYVGPNASDASRLLNKYQLSWPQSIDNKNRVLSSFQVRHTPHITIIGADGAIVFDENMSNAQIDKQVAQAVADARRSN